MKFYLNGQEVSKEVVIEACGNTHISKLDIAIETDEETLYNPFFNGYTAVTITYMGINKNVWACCDNEWHKFIVSIRNYLKGGSIEVPYYEGEGFTENMSYEVGEIVDKSILGLMSSVMMDKKAIDNDEIQHPADLIDFLGYEVTSAKDYYKLEATYNNMIANSKIFDDNLLGKEALRFFELLLEDY